MSCGCNALPARRAAACPPPVSRRRWVARAVLAMLVALAVAVVESRLIEQAAATSANCSGAAACALVRVVDSSLASGFAPLAILR